MRSSEDVFHLAIPCADLDAAVDFYEKGLGCRLARMHDDRVTFEFFGDQIVCRLAPDRVDEKPTIYPRHFGITFRDKEDHAKILARAREKELPFFRNDYAKVKGEREEHTTFYLLDPSNNVVEFKYYPDAANMY
ncbi:MAG TPA: VOC family protein [Thermoleophilaceae bacterium]